MLVTPKSEFVHIIVPGGDECSNMSTNQQKPSKPESHSILDDILSYGDEFKDEDELL